jgi:hypothetical protein
MKRRTIALLFFFLSLCLALGASYKQIETTHTKIIFEEDFQDYAQIVASFADEVYEELAQFMGYQEKRRVPVVLAARTAWANGYFAPFPSSIFLYLTSPEDRFLGARTEDWLKSLYVHELTHYLHLTQYVGPAKYLRVFGPGVSVLSTVFMPGWWIEGITTYTESNFARGGRGDYLLFALNYHVAHAQGSMWSLKQGFYGGPFHPSSRIYLTGYMMVDYLIRHHGVEAFDAINKKFASFPFVGMKRPFEKVIGFSDEQLFQFALQEFPVLEKASSEQFSPVLKGHSYLPSKTDIGLIGYSEASYEGSRLYRYDQDEKRGALMQLPLNGGSSISFAKDKAVFSFLWSDILDGSALEMAPVGYSDLYLLDLKTFEHRAITHKKRLVHPAISGDGTRIVASEIDGPFHRLVEIDQNSGSVIPLIGSEGASYLESTLNSDGSSLVALRTEGGNASLILIDGKKEVRTLIGPTNDELRSPTFTDDGDVLFVSDLGGIYSLYLYEQQSGDVWRLYSDAFGLLNARFVGEDVLYESLSSEGRVVKMVNRELLDREPVAEFSPPMSFTSAASASYEVKRYYDVPMLNLILPFPFVNANRFQLGSFIHASSVLRKHTISGTIGYEFSSSRVVASLLYQASLGSSLLQVSTDINRYNETNQSYFNQISTAYNQTIFFTSSPKAQFQLGVQPQFSFLWNDANQMYVPSLGVGGVYSSQDMRRADFFGPSSLRAFAALQLSYRTSNQSWEALTFINASVQQRIGSALSMIRLSADLAVAPNATVGDSYPLFSFKTQKDGAAKLRVSGTYRLPLTLLDIGIPFGGITGLGLEVGAQSAWYIAQGSVVWEDVWAVGATLSVNMLAGSIAVPVRPFMTLAYAIGLDKWQFTIGIDNQSIITLPQI